MPLTGGAADKLGNRYELWWTVAQLERMLHGEIVVNADDKLNLCLLEQTSQTSAT